MGDDRQSADAAHGGAPMLDIELALAQLSQGAALAMRSSLLTLSAADQRRVMAELVRARAAVEAAYLHVLSQFDRCESVLPGVVRRVGFTFLTQAMNYSAGQAGADVAAARALDPTGAGFTPDLCGGLPRLAAALAAGEVSRAHVDVAVRCLGRVPQHLADRVDADGVSGRTKIDSYLTEQSRRHSPTTTDRLAKLVLAALDPDGHDRFDPLSHERRHLSMVTDSTGMTIVRGALDPTSAAVFRAALTHYKVLGAAAAGPEPADSDTADAGNATLPIKDSRTPGQRSVDALAALCRAALRAHYPGHGQGGPGRQPAAPLARVIIVATPEQAAAAARRHPGARTGSKDVAEAPGFAREAESGEPISPHTLNRLMCDAELQTVVLDERRAVLTMGRATRLATPAQRTALVARDRGCIAPGCQQPPSSCEAHHVIWWRHGGRTDIDNLALVCPQHHTLIHGNSGWRLEMHDRVPVVVPPDWLDPGRKPRSNGVHTAEDGARRLGRSIALQQHLRFPDDP